MEKTGVILFMESWKTYLLVHHSIDQGGFEDLQIGRTHPHPTTAHCGLQGTLFAYHFMLSLCSSFSYNFFFFFSVLGLELRASI
jgi:hypothetical protein